jgi:outer membrane protein assembly factor BamB
VSKEFGGLSGKWAYSESPLIDGDTLVCTPGGKTATLLALNKKTGDVTWKSAVPGGDSAGYASVIITNAGGIKQYVQFLGSGVVGVDAKNGKFLWRYDKTAKGSPANMPTPVAQMDLVYSATGKGGAGLVRLMAGGDGVKAEQVYFERNLPTSIGGAVLLNGFIYGTNENGLVCADFATGKPKWQNPCIGAGSVCFADGRIYVHGENGKAAMVEATPDAYKEKGRFTPPDQPDHGKSKAWAYPVVANGHLYLHDWGTVWCYDIKAGSAAN